MSFFKVQPLGVMPLDDSHRKPIIRVIGGDTWRTSLNLYNPANPSEAATPDNTIVSIKLAETQFDEPLWEGEWYAGVYLDKDRSDLCHIEVPKSITKSLRRGSYMFSVRVSDLLMTHIITEAQGSFLVEYTPTSYHHSIPYKDGEYSEETKEEINIKLTSNIIDGTYSELKARCDNSTLIPGAKYKMIDFVTKENTSVESKSSIAKGLPFVITSAEHPYDLILTAISSNKFDPRVIAMPHEGDVYFLNEGVEDITQWQLWYDIQDNEGEKKGSITRMIDTNGNEAPYDFKNILINGKYTFHSLATDSDLSLIHKSNICKYNVIKGEKEYNGAFRVISCVGNEFLYNVFAEDCHNIFLGSSTIRGSNSISGITIGSSCTNIYIYGECENISIGKGCGEIHLTHVKRSSIGTGTANVVLGGEIIKKDAGGEETVEKLTGRQITIGNQCNYVYFGSLVDADMEPYEWDPNKINTKYLFNNGTIDSNVGYICFTRDNTVINSVQKTFQNFHIRSGIVRKRILANSTNKLTESVFTILLPKNSPNHQNIMV